MSILLLVLGIFLFVALVVVHEFGHFIAARRNGVEVEEFAIGFPPRAWEKKLKNGTLFTLNWLPLGGFVKLKGEHDADTEPHSFGMASLRAKIKIMLAGVGMNLLAAWVLLTFLALVGMPKLIDNQFSVTRDAHVTKQQVLVGYIEPGSPADKAGLQTRDQLLGLGCVSEACAENISTADNLPKQTQHFAGQTTGILIKRGATKQVANVTFRTHGEVEKSKQTDSPKGYLGVAPTEYTLQRYTWSAPVEGLGIIAQFTKLTFAAIGHALVNVFSGHPARASEQVAGPVGIVVLLKDGSLLGYHFMLMIIAVISLTLAIMNALPIPALDGGRLFVMLLFRALKKPLTKTKEEWIHGTGFALLMALFVLITIVDIRRYF